MVDSKHEMSKGNNTIDTFQKIELVAEKLIATNSYVLHLDGTLQVSSVNHYLERRVMTDFQSNTTKNSCCIVK